MSFTAIAASSRLATFEAARRPLRPSRRVIRLARRKSRQASSRPQRSTRMSSVARVAGAGQDGGADRHGAEVRLAGAPAGFGAAAHHQIADRQRQQDESARDQEVGHAHPEGTQQPAATYHEQEPPGPAR